MRISCPVCGERSVAEFTYAGDATVAMPALDAPAEAWNAYVYDRENPRGRHREHWQHTHGCRSWLAVERDTATHAVTGVALLGRAAGKAGA